MLNAEAVRYARRLEEVDKAKGVANRILRYFPETFMGNGHRGLAKIAKEHGIDVFNLKAGEFVLFMNKDQRACKLFSPGNIVAHLKMPGNARINPKIIPIIPRFFNGSEIKYDQALKKVIEREFR